MPLLTSGSLSLLANLLLDRLGELVEALRIRAGGSDVQARCTVIPGKTSEPAFAEGRHRHDRRSSRDTPHRIGRLPHPIGIAGAADDDCSGGRQHGDRDGSFAPAIANGDGLGLLLQVGELYHVVMLLAQCPGGDDLHPVWIQQELPAHLKEAVGVGRKRRLLVGHQNSRRNNP